jgi:hypothetical protein
VDKEDIALVVKLVMTTSFVVCLKSWRISAR